MRAERASAGVIVVGALLVLGSLYLPWFGSLDGWETGRGEPIALAALLLLTLAAAAVSRPGLLRALPVAAAAVASGQYALAAAVRIGWLNPPKGITLDGYGRGAAVGLSAAGLAIVAGAVTRRRELKAMSRADAAAATLALALPLTFLLPWARERTFHEPAIDGILSIPATACACAFLGCRPTSTRRMTFGFSAAVFVAGLFWQSTRFASLDYGAWVGLGVAVGLAVLTALGWRGKAQRPGHAELAVAVPAVALLVALSLPWNRTCFPPSAGIPCQGFHGWDFSSGAAAAVLALLLTSIALLRLDLFVTARELALGIALLIAAAGHALDLGTIGGVRTSIAYGAVIAFAAAAALLVVLFVGAPLPPRGSLRVVGAPAALAAVYVLLVVLSYLDLLPDRVEWYGARHGSWLAISGALIGLHLVEHWGWRRGSYPWLLVLLPLELCATAVLYLLEDRSAVTWGGGIVVVLTLLLAWLGRVEASRGLEHFELPAILRIDRI